MKTRKQLEAVMSKADTRVFELYCEYEAETEWFVVRRGKSTRVATLKERFTAEHGSVPEKLSEVVEKLGVKIYEENLETNSPKYIECTKRAVKRLRTLEKRIAEWEQKGLEAEDALNNGEYAE